MASVAKPKKDFDVGGRGITGHYSTMLGKLRDNTAEGVMTVVFWSWVLTWPRSTVILQLGPVVTVALLIRLYFALWTIRVWARIITGLWYAWRWQLLERRGPLFTWRNDHALRIVFYRRSDNRQLFDSTTQQERLAQEISVNRRRRDTVSKEVQALIRAVGSFLLLPLAYFLFPVVVGHSIAHLVELVLAHVNLDEGVALLKSSTASNKDLSPYVAIVCDWLTRPDVHSILTGYDLKLSILYLFFVRDVVPVFSNLAWTGFDALIHRLGCQYVPGSKVLEVWVPELTLDAMRGEKVHGNVEFVSPEDAVRGMSG